MRLLPLGGGTQGRATQPPEAAFRLLRWPCQGDAGQKILQLWTDCSGEMTFIQSQAEIKLQLPGGSVVGTDRSRVKRRSREVSLSLPPDLPRSLSHSFSLTLSLALPLSLSLALSLSLSHQSRVKRL